MKRSFLLLLVAIFAVAQIAHAHPPSKIDATYDASTEMLEVYITHKVEDPEKHYIGKVVIELDGQNIIETKLFLQDDNEGLSLSYRIPDVTPGNVIAIKAECNVEGSLMKKIVVE